MIARGDARLAIAAIVDAGENLASLGGLISELGGELTADADQSTIGNATTGLSACALKALTTIATAIDAAGALRGIAAARASNGDDS